MNHSLTDSQLVKFRNSGPTLEKKATVRWIGKKKSRIDITRSLFKLNSTSFDKETKTTFIKSLIYNSYEKCVQKEIKCLDYTTEKDLLISELKKTSFFEGSFGGKKFIRKYNNDKNFGVIATLLKGLQGFRSFLQFNKIDDAVLLDSAMHIKLKSFKKGDLIFREGDKSDAFYGIIKGRVELKIHILVYISTDYRVPLCSKPQIRTQYLEGTLCLDQLKVIDQTILILNEGQCFGELGLVYEKDRTASAYAFEDLDLFVVDKDAFQIGFSKCIYIADFHRKQYICHVFPFLAHLEQKTIDMIYKLMIIKFYRNKEIVYIQNTQADFFYLIYQGECVITTIDLSKNLNPVYVTEENHSKKLMYFTRGCILGLETIDKYIDSSQAEPVFKYTCYSTSNFTVIYQIDLTRLPSHRFEFINMIKSLGPQNEKILKNISLSQSKFSNKYKINYRNKSQEHAYISELLKNNKTAKLISYFEQRERSEKIKSEIKPVGPANEVKLENIHHKKQELKSRISGLNVYNRQKLSQMNLSIMSSMNANISPYFTLKNRGLVKEGIKLRDLSYEYGFLKRIPSQYKVSPIFLKNLSSFDEDDNADFRGINRKFSTPVEISEEDELQDNLCIVSRNSAAKKSLDMHISHDTYENSGPLREGLITQTKDRKQTIKFDLKPAKDSFRQFGLKTDQNFKSNFTSYSSMTKRILNPKLSKLLNLTTTNSQLQSNCNLPIEKLNSFAEPSTIEGIKNLKCVNQFALKSIQRFNNEKQTLITELSQKRLSIHPTTSNRANTAASINNYSCK